MPTGCRLNSTEAYSRNHHGLLEEVSVDGFPTQGSQAQHHPCKVNAFQVRHAAGAKQEPATRSVRHVGQSMGSGASSTVVGAGERVQ